MSTIAPDRPHTAPQPPAAPSGGSPWVASWRLALRMGWREIKRARWRNLLVILLVGAPVALVVAGLTLYQTTAISPKESIPLRLGAAQAEISAPAEGQIKQNADLTSAAMTHEKPQPWPVAGSATDEAVVAAGMAKLVPGARLLPFTTGWVSAKIDGHWSNEGVVYASPQVAADPALRGKLDLVSGHWPSGPTEVVIDERLVARGAPNSGTIELRPESERATFTIVGVARAFVDTSPAGFVLPATVAPKTSGDPVYAGAMPGQPGAHRYLVTGPTPISWDTVRLLNRYGVVVFSREVVSDPPAGSMDPVPSDGDYAWQVGYGDNTDAILGIMATLLLAGLLLETTLLAGPAFAISAARQRHSLALAASNGATTRHLRRLVLGQALILGAITAVVGVLCGLALAAIGAWAFVRWSQPGWVGPYDVPAGWVLGILLGATAACVVAALIPARGLDRIDVVGVLRGSQRSGRVHRGLPVVGAVLFGLGVIGTVLTLARVNDASNGDTNWLVTGVIVSAVLLVVGAVCLIPVALVWLGALTRRLPAPMRMATRDATRQRGRAVPTVAAVLGGAALLAATAISINSSDAHDRAAYTPQAPMGWGFLYAATDQQGKPVGADRIASAVRSVDPALVISSATEVSQNLGNSADAYLWISPSACQTDQSCDIAMSDGTILVADPSTLKAAQLTPAALAALDRGDVVVAVDPAMASPGNRTLRTGDQLTLSWRKASDGARDPGKPSATLTAFVVEVSARSPIWNTVISPATAQHLQATTRPGNTYLQDPNGAITTQTQDQLQQSLDNENLGSLYVERGYQGAPVALYAGLFGLIGGLIVLAAVVATALSLSEARKDLTTLASVGAKPSSRRIFAATQAGFVAGIGMLLGYLVGGIPGIVGVRNMGPGGYDVVIPWWWLLGAFVATVLLAAAIGALLVRRNPSLVRRDR